MMNKMRDLKMILFLALLSIFVVERSWADRIPSIDQNVQGAIQAKKAKVGGLPDRYAKVPEFGDLPPRSEMDDVEGFEKSKCPLCEDDPMTPCGRCRMCKAGFPCEKALCRHCIQSRSMNMCNSCDLSAGDEPCGTCDACREHRSDPCEHADDGHGPKGEFNPYKEPTFGATLPRPITDLFNNGARKFPVYYNPAPYYRPHWNPVMWTGYARPYTMRWSCPLCFKDPCECNKKPYAGQVPMAFTCKFCGRTPCACAGQICNVTKPLDPEGTSKSLAAMTKDSTRIQDTHNVDNKTKAKPSTSLLDDLMDKTPEKGKESGKERKPRLTDEADSEENVENIKTLKDKPKKVESSKAKDDFSEKLNSLESEPSDDEPGNTLPALKKRDIPQLDAPRNNSNPRSGALRPAS